MIPLSPARQRHFGRGLLASLSLAATIVSAQIHPGSDFADLSLEELVQVEISSLGRKNTTVFDTPAPAYIVVNDEIHRNGALSLPEALRLVPGVQVSRIDAANYAITIRGFNDFTSNKLLVLKDGRSVYNQQFSGANWVFQEAMLADVSRVEVQRGPAGALWGANAVNGVVNLVSKNAHSTIGTLISAATGDQFDSVVEIRHGWNITPSTAARVYLKHQDQGDYDTIFGAASKGWTSGLVGTRVDWDRPGGGGLTVIGEHREVRLKGTSAVPSLIPPYSSTLPDVQSTRGTDLTAKWNQPIFDDGRLSVQGSIERGSSDQLISGEHHTTADFEAQLTLYPRPNHEVITGVTYRSTADSLTSTPWFTYDQNAATTTFVGVFAQDEITLIPAHLRLTLGAKIERNSYSGWETQPNARLLWHPSRDQSVWTGISRAARTPSRLERGVNWFAHTFPPTPELPVPVKLVALGDENFDSEHVTTFELGHRLQKARTFSLDTALFYSDYSDLRGLIPSIVPPDFTSVPVHATYYYTATNNIDGYTFGGEIAARWQPAASLRFDASVATVRTFLHTPSGLPDDSIPGLEGNTPREEYKLHAGWDFSRDWSLDLFGRHTGRLRGAQVPAYTGLDVRLAWRARPHLELELVGRDVLDASHAELSDFFVTSTIREVARSFYFRVTYKR